MRTFKPSKNMTFETVRGDCLRLAKFCDEEKSSVLRLDLSEVKYCDSAGLALLIQARKRCKAENKRYEITGMPKVVEALAEFCGVDKILLGERV